MAPVGLAPGFYGISDAAWGEPVSLALRLARAGCQVVQLRAKDWPAEQILEAGRKLVSPFRALGTHLIINDHLSIAIELGVGVHLGQDDAEPAEAKQHLAPEQLVGLSTHTLEQVKAAQHADYLGFGPIFATHSKKGALPPRGLRALAEAVSVCRLPLVAIGGIGPENVAAVRATGVHAWTAIGATLGSEDLEGALNALRGLS